jgi:hypothetical protein
MMKKAQELKRVVLNHLLKKCWNGREALPAMSIEYLVKWTGWNDEHNEWYEF